MKKFVVFLLLLAAPTFANDGSAPEETTLNVKSKLTFVDRSKFVDRGTVEYSLPEKRNDGIEVGDAREIADLSGIMEFLNEIEKENQDFRIGKGAPRKRKSKNSHEPLIEGCIDSVLVAKDGKLVLEEYFADARIDKPHYQMSITKSVLSYAIGKAIDQGKIKSENDLLLDYLPDVNRSKIAEGVEALTLADLLSMQSGIRWNGAGRRPKVTIENHAELYLSQTGPIPDEKPFKYDGANCDLLGHVLYNTTGKTLGEFAGEYLFAPMGIADFAFGRSSCGLDKGAAGMRLRSRDMLKIGLMTSNGGEWNEMQILSSDWVTKATAVHANENQPSKYGYFWWSQNAMVNGKTYRVRSCRGAGGQYIFVVPELDIVAVFTSYYANNKPLQHMESIILPAFAGRTGVRRMPARRLTGVTVVEPDQTASPYGYLMRKHVVSGDEGRTLPVVIRLHGAGGGKRGVKGMAMPEEKLFAKSGHSYLFIKPATNTTWEADKLDQLVETIKADYAGDVDADRIYMFGTSMGGYGSWRYCIDHGDMIAAMISIEGGFIRGSGPIDKFDFQHFKTLPVWVFHNRDDKVVPLKYAEELIEAAKAVGGSPRFTLHEDGGHGSRLAVNLNEEVLDWLFSQSLASRRER